jgi:hypothetical protein
VTSTPPAINCGASCAASVPLGTTITLSAQPDPDSRFDGWSGACAGAGPCTLEPTSDATVTALFTYVPARYVLAVERSGSGRGVVKSAPEGIDCGEKCSTTFSLGTTVTLTATPESKSAFAGWSGACTGSGNCVVSMTRQYSVTAKFDVLTPRGRPVRH